MFFTSARIAATSALLLTTLSPAPAATAADLRTVSDRRGYSSSRIRCGSTTVQSGCPGHAKSNRNVVAWGQPRRLSRPRSSSQVQVADERKAAESPEEERSRTGLGVAEDDSWTHAAFRAFHELRAGAPPSVEENDEAATAAGAEKESDLRARWRFWTSRRQRDQNKSSGSASEEAQAKIDAASGPAPVACWHMRGRLTNTATGQTIAIVEGVELTRSLAFATAGIKEQQSKRTEEVRRGSELAMTVGESGPGSEDPAATEALEVDRVLETEAWTAYGTLACRKFFMYQDPKTGEPMTFFRNTPVDKKQKVRTYERFSQVVSHLLRPNGRLMVVSEWGGRSVKAETANNNGVEEIGGGASGFGYEQERLGLAGSDERASRRRVFNLHFFVEARTAKEERELKRWRERPGARWIAFGAMPPRAHGCKEAYSYVAGDSGGRSGGVESRARGKRQSARRGKGRMDDTVAVATAAEASGRGGLMSYTRYGECPTWYGTGRMCGLDVQAKRVDSFESLPAGLRQKVMEVDPDFDAGLPDSLEECRVASSREREARDERRRRQRRLRLPRVLRSRGVEDA